MATAVAASVPPAQAVVAANVADKDPWITQNLENVGIPSGLIDLPIRLNSITRAFLVPIEATTEPIAFMDTVEALKRTLESDQETAKHTKRVTRLSIMLASKCGFTLEELAKLEIATELHDIGKLFVPEAILKNPGRPSEEEFEQIKMHPEMACAVLDHFPALAQFTDIPRYHHEKWNGRGYPYGLAGNDIPIGARIVAIADVYDAIRAERCYKSGNSQERTIEIMESMEGHFDPRLFKIFKANIELWDRVVGRSLDGYSATLSEAVVTTRERMPYSILDMIANEAPLLE